MTGRPLYCFLDPKDISSSLGKKILNLSASSSSVGIGLKIIMLTGHATVNSAIEAMKLGAPDYLMKPCDLEELVLKVKAAANRKRSHETKILEARMKPYISKRDKEKMISKILDS